MQRPTYHPYYLAEVEDSVAPRTESNLTLKDALVWLARVKAELDHCGDAFTSAYHDHRRSLEKL